MTNLRGIGRGTYRIVGALLWTSGLAALAPAQSTGTFIATGQMKTDRYDHAATLLRDGRVLITGGIISAAINRVQQYLARAEIFDPSTGIFQSAGNLTTPRYSHTATLLKDGRVLIAGGLTPALVAGFPGSAPSFGTEVFDPSAGTFQRSGDMLRSGRAVTVFDNGQVLFAGAAGDFQVYDPIAGTFADAGRSPDAISQASATPLADGTILLVGTNPEATGIVTTIYDPALGTFRRTGSSTRYPAPGEPLYGFDPGSSTLLANGSVLSVGGSYSSLSFLDYEPFERVEVYEPATGAFSLTDSLKTTRLLHTATMLPGGAVLIAGGEDAFRYDRPLTSAELYDPASGKFASASDMTAARSGHTATLLADGTVLIAGGYDHLASRTLNRAELYVPARSAVSSAGLAAPLAPGSLASMFGPRLGAIFPEAVDDLRSLPTTLGGVSLGVGDSSGVERPALLLYVSPTQINFVVPAGTAPGAAVLNIANGSTRLPPVSTQIRTVAPGLLATAANQAVAYALRVEANGQLTYLPPFTPIVLDDRPVYLILFGTGIHNRSGVDRVQCTIGGISVPVEYAGPSGDMVVGLDQVNLRLPGSLKGNRDPHLVLTVDGQPANTVLVDVR